MEIIDFDLELAKKITNGEIKGKVLYCSRVLTNPLNARIVCFDCKLREDETRGIVLSTSVSGLDTFNYFNLTSGRIGGVGYVSKLMLEVPDIYSYKKGDILVSEGEPFIFDRYDSEKDEVYSLAGLMLGGTFKEKSDNWCFTERIEGKADQAQIDRLMNAIKKNGYRWDAEKLELLKLEKKHQFKPFDRVIGFDDNDKSYPDIFRYISSGGTYYCLGGIYSKIVPFDGNEGLLNSAK